MTIARPLRSALVGKHAAYVVEPTYCWERGRLVRLRRKLSKSFELTNSRYALAADESSTPAGAAPPGTRPSAFPALRLRFHLLRGFLMRQDIARVGRGRRIDRHVAFVDVLNDPLLVYDKGGAITIAALFIEDSVVPDNRAFEVA